MLDQLAARVTAVAAPMDITQPTPQRPPGTEGLDVILSWALYTVMFLAVLGVLITAGMMVVAHNQGRGGDHMGRLGFVFGGMVLAGSAALLVNMVM